jgi:hypothetical protein
MAKEFREFRGDDSEEQANAWVRSEPNIKNVSIRTTLRHMEMSPRRPNLLIISTTTVFYDRT